MSKRSAWKGPFIDYDFLVESLKASSKKPIETRSRDSVILPYLVGKTLKVYNGKKSELENIMNE